MHHVTAALNRALGVGFPAEPDRATLRLNEAGAPRMPLRLTQAQADQYHRDGFCGPIPVLTPR
jgi:hypothetical protein